MQLLFSPGQGQDALAQPVGLIGGAPRDAHDERTPDRELAATLFAERVVPGHRQLAEGQGEHVRDVDDLRILPFLAVWLQGTRLRFEWKLGQEDPERLYRKVYWWYWSFRLCMELRTYN